MKRVRNSIFIKKYKTIMFMHRQYPDSYVKLIAFVWLLFIVIIGTVGSGGARTANPVYTMMFSTINFSSQFLQAAADDLSNPAQSTFHLENGSLLWYGITITSNPAGMLPIPVDAANDLVTATFFDKSPLLPPIYVLPFDQQNNAYHYEVLKLQAAFFGPGQQLRLTLSPTDPHAVALDMLDLLLNLFGQRTGGAAVGLLAPGTLIEVLALTATMKDFHTLVEDYIQVLQNAQNMQTVQTSAQQCAVDIKTLLADSEEKSILTDILWKMLGKAISREHIFATVTNFSSVQFEMALVDFMKNVAVSLSFTLFERDMPAVVLQTTSTPTPTPTPTPSPTPTPTPEPTPIPTPTPTPTVVPMPTIIYVPWPPPQPTATGTPR